MQLCTRSGGSNGSCGSVALNCSDGSGGLMSLLDLFVLVDLVCQLVFFGLFYCIQKNFQMEIWSKMYIRMNWMILRF